MSTGETGQGLHVAFVGVGRMGSVMLKCVLDGGYHATLCDPSEQALAPFLEAYPKQVTVAPTPAEASREADVIEIVVNTNEQLLEACLGANGVLEGARPGAVVLVHSTVAHDTLRRLADVATARGVQLLDAMVSGARGHLSVPDLAVMVGGEQAAFERAKPVMDTYGGLVLRLGEQGAGLDAKLALNMYRYICMAAGLEATRLADSAGIGEHMGELVAHTHPNRYVGNFARLGPMQKIPEPARRKDAVLAQKDLRAAIARGESMGLQMPGATLAVELMHGLWGVPVESESDKK